LFLGGIKILRHICDTISFLHNCGDITHYQFSAMNKDIVIINNLWFSYFLGNILDEVLIINLF
jgi:hypothetical protein